jgi:hypothetical protein
LVDYIRNVLSRVTSGEQQQWRDMNMSGALGYQGFPSFGNRRFLELKQRRLAGNRCDRFGQALGELKELFGAPRVAGAMANQQDTTRSICSYSG